MLVLSYIRVSTDEQAENGNSLFEQQERNSAFCKAKGWDDPIFFIDDGYSAKNINRPELTKLLERVKNEPGGGVVLTTKLDRLSRKLLDILNLNAYFDKYNFGYVSASEGFDTSTAAGRLVLQMLGMVAEFERERISENVRNNMISIAKNTTKVISRPCFGFDIIDGEYVINIDESLYIINAARDLLSGRPARSIIKQWNLVDNIRTKEGNEWHEKTFRELFQRETLIGDFVYNKTYKKGNKVITRPEDEWVYIENHHSSILDKETFKRLGELFQGRKKIGRHLSDDRYLLSGLVVCGHCRNKMNGKMYKNFSKKMNRENIHYKYLCDGYLKKATCYHHYVGRDLIETLILNEIKKLSESAPGTLKIVVDNTRKDSIDKNAIKAKLEKLDKRMQKQIDAYNDDLISAHDLKLASERVEKERSELLSLLNSSKKDTEQKQQEEIVKKAKTAMTDLLPGDRLKTKQVIREFIEKIEVLEGEKISIVWRVN